MPLRDTYQAHLLRHLVDYKRKRLGVTVSGTFRYRGRDVTHAHILPTELKWLNILEPIRAEVHQHVLDARNQIKLHRYFHHLNSSQACALNLFFPYFASGPRAAARIGKAVAGSSDVFKPRFEHVPVPKEGTNVDVEWVASDGSHTYIEFKLSEAEFGKAEADARHLSKLDQTYRRDLSRVVDGELLETKAFLGNYQILRNLWLAARDPRARLVFLLPRANEALWPPLKRVLRGVESSLLGRIRTVALEPVLAGLEADRESEGHLRLHAARVAEKYVIPDGNPA